MREGSYWKGKCNDSVIHSSETSTQMNQVTKGESERKTERKRTKEEIHLSTTAH